MSGPSYEIAIVAHTDRREQAYKLMGDTNASHMAMDDGRFGAGQNHLLAWDWLNKRSAADWAIVLEDDAIPCESFHDQLEMSLAVAPSSLVSLYLGRARPPHVQDSIASVIVDPKDPCWLMSDMLYHHVGVAVSRQWVGQMTDGATHLIRRYPIDEAIGRWAQSRRIRISYTNPSLVDHRWDQLTVIKYRALDGTEDLVERKVDKQSPRRAWRFGPRSEWDDSFAVIPPPVPLGDNRFIPF